MKVAEKWKRKEEEIRPGRHRKGNYCHRRNGKSVRSRGNVSPVQTRAEASSSKKKKSQKTGTPAPYRSGLGFVFNQRSTTRWCTDGQLFETRFAQNFTSIPLFVIEIPCCTLNSLINFDEFSNSIDFQRR